MPEDQSNEASKALGAMKLASEVTTTLSVHATDRATRC